MFNLNDEYQLKLYNYLKKHSNGSSYVRTLIHMDLFKNKHTNTNDLILKDYQEDKDVIINKEINEIENQKVKEDNNEIFLDGII